MCGTGVGTFLLAPINRFLTDKYGWEGAFLIKAAIVLNGCVCGALMRPVPIEPSEVLKREKKLEKNPKEKPQIEKPTPKILITEPDDKPIRIEKSVYSQDNINLNNVDYDPCAFAKSLPLLNNNNQNSNIGNGTNNRMRINMNHKKSQLSIKNAYSSMDILAHTRSLQTIKVSTNKIEDDIDEQNEHEPKSLIQKINQYIDLTIFRDGIFVYFAISNFLTSLGFNAPYIYIVDQATKLDIPSNMADMLLSTIGISNTVGRIALGLIADIKGVNRLYLYASVLTISGIATMIEPFCTNFIGLMVYSVVFGFTSGN